MEYKYFLATILLVSGVLFASNALKANADTLDDQIKLLQSEVAQLNTQLMELTSSSSASDPYVSYIKDNKDSAYSLDSSESVAEQMDLINMAVSVNSKP